MFVHYHDVSVLGLKPKKLPVAVPTVGVVPAAVGAGERALEMLNPTGERALEMFNPTLDSVSVTGVTILVLTADTKSPGRAVTVFKRLEGLRVLAKLDTP
jgi:hypothetical protein